MLLLPVVSIAMMAMLGRNDIGYTNYPVIMQAVIAIFLASQSPTITAPDLRFKVLPLYLSRPVSTLDYVAAKVVAMAHRAVRAGRPAADGECTRASCWSTRRALRTPRSTSRGSSPRCCWPCCCRPSASRWPPSPPRRGLGVASVIAVYLLASAVSTVLFATFESMGRADVAQWAWLVNPFFLVDSVQSWLFGTTPANGYTYPAGVFSRAPARRAARPEPDGVFILR
ncbi:hypothetical protein GCM10020219_038360 [Nonomuraea dietziae]